MIRRITAWTAALVVAGGLAVASYVGLQELADDGAADELAQGPVEEFSLDTSVAEVRTLTETHEVEGTIAYDTSLPVASPVDGTVRESAEAATVTRSGDVLVRVDGVAVVWLDGAIPAWRTMQVGDEGPDVEQLEVALSDLGFDAEAAVTVDQEFDSSTAAMVEAWQESIGTQPTGVVEFGSIVFGGARDRVTSNAAEVGAAVQAGDELVWIDTGRRIVSFDVAPAEAVGLEAGDTVAVALPDSSTVHATIESELANGEAVTVVATFGDVALPSRDAVAVDVSWERHVVADAVTVPSSALLRLDDGNYVVDVVAGGRLERRQVEIGRSVGTRTEILLGLTAGDEVLVL